MNQSCFPRVPAGQDYNVLRRAHLPLTPSNATFTSTHPECEVSYQVSGGTFKVSQTKGGPSLHSTRSSLEAQNGRPHFLEAFLRLLSRCHGGATGVPFRAHGPRRCPQDRASQLGLLAVLVWLARTLSFRPPSTSCTISTRLPPP
jgi:hypothetical protein